MSHVRGLLFVGVLFASIATARAELPARAFSEQTVFALQIDVAGLELAEIEAAAQAVADLLPEGEQATPYRTMLHDQTASFMKSHTPFREMFIAGGGKSMLVTVALTKRGDNIEPLPTFFIEAEPGADVDKLRASFKTLGPVPVPLIALGDDWYAIDENLPAAGVAAEAASFAKRLEEAGDAPLRAVVRINTPLLKDELARFDEANRDAPFWAKGLASSLRRHAVLTLALHLGDKPVLVARDTYESEEAAIEVQALMDAMYDELSTIAAQKFAAADPPPIETELKLPTALEITAFFDGLSPKRDGATLTTTLGLDQLNAGGRFLLLMLMSDLVKTPRPARPARASMPRGLYFYDVKADRIFVVPLNTLAPIEAPSGGEGLEMVIVACDRDFNGNLEGKSVAQVAEMGAFVAYLQKHSPKARAQMEEAMKDKPNIYIRELYPAPLVRRLTDEQWYDPNNPGHQEEYARIMREPRDHCAPGQFPRRVLPRE